VCLQSAQPGIEAGPDGRTGTRRPVKVTLAFIRRIRSERPATLAVADLRARRDPPKKTTYQLALR